MITFPSSSPAAQILAIQKLVTFRWGVRESWKGNGSDGGFLTQFEKQSSLPCLYSKPGGSAEVWASNVVDSHVHILLTNTRKPRCRDIRQLQDPLLTLRCTWKLIKTASFQASGLSNPHTWLQSPAVARNPARKKDLDVLRALREPGHGGASLS